MIKKNILASSVVIGTIILGLVALQNNPLEPQNSSAPNIQTPPLNTDQTITPTSSIPKENKIIIKKTKILPPVRPVVSTDSIIATATPKISNETPPTHTDSPVPENSISVALEIPDKKFTLDINKNSSAYDLMAAAQEKKILTFSSQKYDSLGYMITEINGMPNSNTDRKYWIYYINNKKANIGLSNYILNSNDLITWKYEDQE